MFPKPTREPKPRRRIKTYRPAGMKRREAKAAGGVDQDTWAAICAWYEDDHGVVLCAYGCGRPATVQDHVIPLSWGPARGGVHAPHNVVPCCEAENIEKGQQTWEVPNPHPWMATRS